jgi:hypothetical protein
VETRNPYLILGIPFGASREDANIAFARRTKGLRQVGGRAGAAGRDQLTDLTWALNQIDEVTTNPQTVFDVYRIPADPEAFAAAGAGVLSPPPEALAPRGGDRGTALSRLQVTAAHEFLRYQVLLRAGVVELPAP